jgi:hypothetical protein
MDMGRPPALPPTGCWYTLRIQHVTSVLETRTLDPEQHDSRNEPLPPGQRARCSSRDRRGSSPAGERLLALFGLGAKGPSRSLRVD